MTIINSVWYWTAAVDEMKERCANYLEDRANELEKQDSVTAHTVREEAKVLEALAV